MIKFEFGCADQTIDVNYDLYIFEQTHGTSEPIIELVRREMLIFKHY
jgi:hypothetical protein